MFAFGSLWSRRRNITRLSASKATNWMPFVGATLRQFAALPLKKPRIPSLAKSWRSSTNSGRVAPVEHMLTVATTSNGDTAVREMMPAIACEMRCGYMVRNCNGMNGRNGRVQKMENLRQR